MCHVPGLPGQEGQQMGVQSMQRETEHETDIWKVRLLRYRYSVTYKISNWRGTGPECRKLVQQLNLKRGEKLDFESELLISGNEMAPIQDDENQASGIKFSRQEQDSKSVYPSSSMWSKYL